ncbi:hypothetical protein B0H66DRAFT_525484 [Apodospora peruviana]|uniref:RNA polymerase II subunit B1 CTD phosphatase RPAP2 homolog n=1 Tax=Apodospora peruviana TaxID=516989 RepID=A0AAE0LYJ5_9PEZI|nr:hypothetical protein B0H66DRAFT_525484 [Apodospora peruviana]
MPAGIPSATAVSGLTSNGEQPQPKPAPRSILKRPSGRGSNTTNSVAIARRLAATAPSEPDQTLLEQAVRQAEILQRLKDDGELREPVPIETFERLSTFPLVRSTGLSAANPSPQDKAEFIAAVETFVPAEYDDLIEERNVVGNCGYALCPRPRRRFVGEWKIRPYGIARVAELNKWCSEKCARRALHIKVQLDNPTYLRRRGPDGNTVTVTKIELREEEEEEEEEERPQQPTTTTTITNDTTSTIPIATTPSTTTDNQAATDNNNNNNNNNNNKKKERAEALAVERGDAGYATQHLRATAKSGGGNGSGSVEVTIREKETVAPAQRPGHERRTGDQGEDDHDDAHLMLEGHKTTFGTSSAGRKVGEEQDDEDSDDDDFDFLPTIRF